MFALRSSGLYGPPEPQAGIEPQYFCRDGLWQPIVQYRETYDYAWYDYYSASKGWTVHKAYDARTGESCWPSGRSYGKDKDVLESPLVTDMYMWVDDAWVKQAMKEIEAGHRAVGFAGLRAMLAGDDLEIQSAPRPSLADRMRARGASLRHDFYEGTRAT